MANRPREKLQPVSEQMKAWSSALAAEFRDWPQITLKSFFGFTALYRGKFMFGILPRTRSLFTTNAIGFRVERPTRTLQAMIENDPRVAAFDKHKSRWFTLEMGSDSDLHDAIDYMGRAFDAAMLKKTK